MDEKPDHDRLVAFSLGALIGLGTAVLALLVRFFRRASLSSQDGLSQTNKAHSTSIPDQGVFPVSLQDVEMPSLSVQAAALVPDLVPGKTLTSSGPRAAGTGVAAGGAVISDGPRWSTPTKYIMGVILFLGALVVLIIGRGVIPMVIFAALLALIINPFIKLINHRLRLKWPAAVALTYVLVLLVLLLIALLMIPNLLSALNFLFTLDYGQLASQAIQYITAFSASLQGNPALSSLLTPLLDSLIKALQNFGTPDQVLPTNTEITLLSLSQHLASRLGVLVNILGPVFTVAVSAVLTLLMALQMSLASNQISGWYPDLIPPAYKGEYSALFERTVNIWVSFLRGQITLMLIIGVAVWLGNLVLGVPFALLLGIIAGLLELIPNVGPTLAAIPAVLLALILGSTYLPIDNLLLALLVIGLYVLIQFLENQFIVPYLMGDAVNLPPLIILIGTIAGATAFGILGALLAAPVIATGNLIFRFVYRKILEPPPIPTSLEEKPSVWERVKGWASRISLPRRKTHP